MLQGDGGGGRWSERGGELRGEKREEEEVIKDDGEDVGSGEWGWL
jgi:hypothetical protein